MNILTFLHDIWIVFILWTYRYSDNCQKISDKLQAGKKENGCAYRFFISRCCKYCLLALYVAHLHRTLRENWKIKGNTEIYSLLFVSKLNFHSFCSRTWHLERESNSSNLYKTHCNKFKHTWLDKALIA